jgi:hypothetical protein
MLDAMEVEALKEVGASTGLTGFGAAITSVRVLRCPCHLLAEPAAAVHPPPHCKLLGCCIRHFLTAAKCQKGW